MPTILSDSWVLSKTLATFFMRSRFDFHHTLFRNHKWFFTEWLLLELIIVFFLLKESYGKGFFFLKHVLGI